MNTLQYEAVKVAMKQDKSGIILTLNIHPDDLPLELLRDFVGARYQVVMVRLNGDDKPMSRDNEYSRDPVRAAGILCRDPLFAEYLHEGFQIFDKSEDRVADWLKENLEIQSRTELRENPQKAMKFWNIQKEFQQWKPNA